MLDTWKSSFQIDKQYTTIAAVTINHIVVAAIILYILTDYRIQKSLNSDGLNFITKVSHLHINRT